MGYRFMRIVVGGFLLATFASLSPASAARVSCPTTFDYLVMASYADAPNILALSTYHRSGAAAARLE
jgi:hypothetical protein